MLRLKRVVRISGGSAIGVCVPLLLAALAMLVVTGCSSRKHKSKPPSPVSITIVTTSLPDATEGVAYSHTIQATGGNSANYNWSMSGQPPWLSINSSTGELSGTPPAGSAGTYTFTVTVTDGQRTASKQFDLTVNPAGSLTITTASLPDATEGAAYSYTVQATGGNSANYTWSISGQPSWLSINSSTGELSGTPPTGSAGTYTFTVEVTDGQQTASKQFDLTVNPAGLLAITTASLPDAIEGVDYSYTLTASGGNSANYNWSVSGQPFWLSINSSTGELSGTPPAGSAGTYTFMVTVTDGQRTTSKQFDLVVKAAPLKADFEANPQYGTAPLTVTFTDKSAGNPTSWQWDFDNDGTVDSTQQNPTYTYNDIGWYTVKLTISDGTNSDTCVKEKYILVADRIYYVDGVGGNDANSGLDWSNAWKTIGKALSTVGDYDLVLVADTTYKEMDLEFGGKKICLKGVDHHKAGAQPVIDCQGRDRAFYFGSGETEDSVVDNFTIKNGNAYFGGAIYCANGSSPTILNCAFSDNYAGDEGGAICCYDSSDPKIVNCTFSGNTSADYAGAILCGFCAPTITGCVFDNNKGTLGGAIICIGADDVVIRECEFNDNSATLYGGAIVVFLNRDPVTIENCTFNANEAEYGGAISAKSNASVTGCEFEQNSADYGGAIAYEGNAGVTLTNCVFSDNSAKNDGGAIYGDFGGFYPRATNCTFSGNSADRFGGAIYGKLSLSPMTGCTFSNNSAGWGGAIYWTETGLTSDIVNCVFSGNSANNDGGAILCDGGVLSFTNCLFSANSAKHDGGTIYCQNSSSVTATNCTFSRNNAEGYGGVIDCGDSDATLNNCILWGNTAYGGGDQIYIYDSNTYCLLNYCCVEKTGYGFASGVPATTIDDSNNCIYDDPQFVDAANGNYHLKDTSPCIDNGDNNSVPSGVATDLDGNQRIVDGDNDGTATVDIGAYEYQP